MLVDPVPHLLNIQKFLIKHKKNCIVGFLLVEISLMVWWMWIYWQAALDYPSVVQILFRWGPFFGQVAVGFYVLTLIPGIINRLGWWPSVAPLVAGVLTVFRRHFGILMFILGFLHLTFNLVLPYLALYNFQPPGLPLLRSFEMMGLVGWLLLFPLWLTSNDWALKKLGKWWKRIHRLTYIALLFIFLHVALQKESLAVLLGAALFFEILSWMLFWRRRVPHQI